MKKALIAIAMLATASIYAGDYALKNPGFEDKTGWDPTTKAHVNYVPDGATPAYEGSGVALCGNWSGGTAGAFLSQSTDALVKAGGEYKLSAYFAPRKDGETRFGGYWLRLIADARASGGGRHVVALLTSDEQLSDWTQKELVWKAPADLSAVPELNGLNGKPLARTANINGAKLEILVGKKHGYGNAYDQTYIDRVRLEGAGGTAPAPKANATAVPLSGEIKKKIATERITSIDDLNVSWTQTGRHSKDSMPLGNGETALNVWTLPDGQIVFYIARTDAWSGLGRLLKLGKVHVKFDPNPFVGEFEQTLDLRNGQILIKGTDGFQAKVWVDANAQTVHIDADADSPFTLEATTELLRPETRPLDGSENHSAYSMHGAPQELMIVEADTLAPAQDNAVSWFHRNGMSAYQVMMKQQALDELLDRMQDPIMNRTFGCLMRGSNLKAENDSTLKSIQISDTESLQIFTHTAITDTAAEWQAQIVRQASSAKPKAEAYAAHKAWWNAFWERSWIFAEGEKPAFYPANPIYDSTMRRKLHIGADNGGGGAFTGRMARASVFDYPLNAAQMKSLYQAGRDGFGSLDPAFKHSWTLDAAADGKVLNKGNIQPIHMRVLGPLEFVEDSGQMVAEFKGDSRLEIEHARGNLRLGGTAEAWIKPAGTDQKGGRIFSLRTPGAPRQGWTLGTTPDGGSLQGIYRTLGATKRGVLKPGEWSHVAMVYDCFYGELRIYVNGEEVARDDYMTHHKQDAGPGIWQMNQGYALQRFVSACAGRGQYPIKFNGSLFTMDGTTEYLGGKIAHDADFRQWGPDYWFQNTRLPYWPMIAAGDFDLMESYWQLYLDTLPMAKERARIYYGHGGAYWPETITFWGTFNGQNYGWSGREDLPDGESKNTHVRYYFDGALELLTMMLDRYEHAPDAAFFNEKILPIATAVLEFYDVHYPRDPDGKLRLKPSQAMETYQWKRYQIENPTNVLAGLQSVTTRLLQYGDKVPNSGEFQRWKNLLATLPPIPVNQETGIIKVAENYERHRVRSNGEEPALYTVFPYQLYGVGRPYLDKFMPTFDEVYPPYGTGWNQDHVFAAQLGRTDIAAPLVYQSFTRNKDGGTRFPAFWGPNYDWLPDQDHGGSAQNALQRMLIQSVDDKIHLLPAWPKDWDVNFKLHAAQNTTVEMIVCDGKIEKLDVQPAWRKADCVLPDWLGGERKSYDGSEVSAPVN